jgi:16S rRNA (cytidine1402-2'-O)-methyltransferase
MDKTLKNVTRVLYLIPSTLGETLPVEVIPGQTLGILKKLDHFIVEEERTARRFLIKAGIEKPVDEITFFILNEHSNKEDVKLFLENTDANEIGLLSEAGVPAVADPGSDLIKFAHQMGYRVRPLIGPSSILLAIMASGLNGQNFSFNGYLPVKTDERIARLKFLEKKSQSEKQAQLFIEAPYRNNQLIRSILDTCSSDTLLCLASNLTLENEQIFTKTIAEWRNGIPDLNKQPTVFIIQRF